MNLGQDLPYLISLTPSVITSSDAGAGIDTLIFESGELTLLELM